ncbi:MAG TPA: response regulator [Pyrinomonadaceae bacterium]
MKSVFYLDDEQDLLDIFHAMFGRMYDVRSATTLAEARRMLAERAPDIIISDQNMPEIKGDEFLREAAALYPESYRIMLTGQAFVGEMFMEIAAGIIQSFVRKPWEKDAMQQLLERATSILDARRTGGPEH